MVRSPAGIHKVDKQTLNPKPRKTPETTGKLKPKHSQNIPYHLQKKYTIIHQNIPVYQSLLFHFFPPRHCCSSVSCTSRCRRRRRRSSASSGASSGSMPSLWKQNWIIQETLSLVGLGLGWFGLISPFFKMCLSF